jgi:O-acetyl-ADP-ribose deacetylase
MLSERIFLLRGDITKQETDAIVNAANSSLLGGGGVDGAIHRAGGPAILAACREIVARQGGCNTGEAVITTAGNLKAKFVIHTVGPVWHGGRFHEAAQLAACYINSLQLAADHHLSSISFPNISTGIYGYPKREAAIIATKSVSDFLEKNTMVRKINFICFDEENFSIYSDLLLHKKN